MKTKLDVKSHLIWAGVVLAIFAGIFIYVNFIQETREERMQRVYKEAGESMKPAVDRQKALMEQDRLKDAKMFGYYTCRFCKGRNDPEAVKCRFCGSVISYTEVK